MGIENDNKNSDLKKSIRNQKEKNKTLQKQGAPMRVHDTILTDEEREYRNTFAEGEQFTECEKCGTVFEQDYRRDINTYSSYKTCNKCRRQKGVPTKKEVREVVQNIATLKYTPHPWQQKFHKDMETIPNAVLAVGSRGGKNRAINMQFIKDFASMLNENRHIERPDLVPSIHCWFVAPVEKLAYQNWRELKAFFPKNWIVAISESTMTIQTVGGGIIEVRSAHDPESLVSVALDWCNITEGARVRRLDEVASNIEDRLNSPSRGVFFKDGKKRSRFMIDSSPLGKNYFYKMWQWGQSSSPYYDSNWISYQLPSSANPEIAEKYAQMVTTKNGEQITYEESLRRRKGRKFLQDNLAQFLEGGGLVFADFKEKCVIDINVGENRVELKDRKEFIKNWKEPVAGERYRVGYDPATGSSGDYPVIVVRQLSNNRIVRLVNLFGKKGDAQLDGVAFWARYYNNAEVCVLTLGAIHSGEQLKGRGINVTELGEQGLGKRGFVEALETAVNNGDINILDDGSADVENLIFQMEDYTQDPKTGKYSNDSEDNDDWVSALYACYYDYSDVVVVKKHYTGRMSGVARKSARKGYAK